MAEAILPLAQATAQNRLEAAFGLLPVPGRKAGQTGESQNLVTSQRVTQAAQDRKRFKWRGPVRRLPEGEAAVYDGFGLEQP